MRHTLASAIVVALTLVAGPAGAGIADSPLPTIDPNAKTIHLYSVPGAITNGTLGTYFSCTSTDTAPVQVGVELFGPAGGGPSNDAVTTSLSVPPGGTRIFGTFNPAGIVIDSNLAGGFFSKGSARILATSKRLVCTAFVADFAGSPPASAWQLTIIAKTKQKAAN